MKSRLNGLWRHSQFMKLWAGQTISEFGSTITREALPLLAMLTLEATPIQMGLLAAAGMAPILLIGLLAGVWVDRLRRRPILIAADLARALLLIWIPVAWILGMLRIEHLYIIAGLTGVLTVFFDVAYQSFLPTLVSRDDLMEGNSKLGMSASLAEMLAPAIGGLLVQILTAPITMLIDAASFLVSAGSLATIRVEEPAPSPAAQSMWREVVAGLHLVGRDAILGTLVLSGAMRSFFGGFFGALYGLYAIRELGMTPALLGTVVATGGIGALLGSLLAGRLGRRFGLGSTLFGAGIFAAATNFLIPLAGGSLVLAVAMMVAAQILGDMFQTIFAINEVSLRQTITADRFLGRVTASTNVIVGGTNMFGLLAGGVAGEMLGLRAGIALACLGGVLSVTWLWSSPVRRVDRAEPVPALPGSVT